MRNINLNLRPCSPSDTNLIFGWRNDPLIISLSKEKKTVTNYEHQKWLTECLNNSDQYKIYIIRVSYRDIGMSRFERLSTSSCKISIYLTPSFWGKGLGVESIQMACTQCFKDWPELNQIIAEVLVSNERAWKAFIHSGFFSCSTSSNEKLNSLILTRP